MLNIGRINRLKVVKLVDFGAYLDSTDGREILLPAKYIIEPLAIGDEIDVFVYNDSEDRLIATTERPYAMVGDFAYMTVAQANKIGAFVDWGITAKDLLVPFREQKERMVEGKKYLIYVYLDDTTKRIAGSTKIDKFIGNVIPRYDKGDRVNVLVIGHAPIGYRCIVDNLHYGMIYDNEIYTPVHVGQKLEAYVKTVREDCKIDLTLADRADRRTNDLGAVIIEALTAAGGHLDISDKSSPEQIQEVFSCSKKDFKKAIGHLYKAHKIEITPTYIKLKARK